MEIKISIISPVDKKKLIPREVYYESNSNALFVIWQLADGYMKNVWSYIYGGYQVSDTVYIPESFKTTPNLYHAVFGGDFVSELEERTNPDGYVVSHNLVVINPQRHKGERPIPIESWEDLNELEYTLQLPTCKMLINFTHSSSMSTTALTDCQQYLQKILPPPTTVDPAASWYDQHYTSESVTDEYQEFMQRGQQNSNSMQIPDRLTGTDALAVDQNLLGAYTLYNDLLATHTPMISTQPTTSYPTAMNETSQDDKKKWAFCTLI